MVNMSKYLFVNYLYNRPVLKIYRGLLLAGFISIVYPISAQVRIAADHSETIAGGAMLEVVSPSASPKGFLPPRVELSSTTTYGLAGISLPGVEGMIVYNTGTSLPNGPGLYIWSSGKWNKLFNDALVSGAEISASGYGYSNLSADQTVSAGGTGTVINISGSPGANNTLVFSGNRVTLKANRLYRLRANGYLLGGSDVSAFTYLAWRKTGAGTNYSGNQALLLAANWGSSYSCGGDATALVKTGSTDETYELVVADCHASRVAIISAEGFFADAMEITSAAPTAIKTVSATSAEKTTGRNWVDGKPIYERTYTLSGSTAATFLQTSGTTYAHGISSFGALVTVRATIFWGGNYYPLPYGANSAPSLLVNATNIISRNSSSDVWSSSTVYITLQYTKTI